MRSLSATFARIALVAVVLAIPFMVSGYIAYQFSAAFVFAIAILGLNLLTGYSGQFSLGQSAFFALGAYTVAILGGMPGVSAFIGIAAAAAVGFLFGFLVGWPVVRFDRVYLALATFGLAIALPQLLKSSHFEPLTGGVQGIYLDRPPVPAWVPLTEDQWWYYVVLATLAGLVWLARNLVNSRTGRAFEAVRDDPLAAQGMGINVAFTKTITFGISAAITAIAGAYSALLSDFVAPDSFGVSLSILLLVGAVLGGVHSIAGAIVGGLLLQFGPGIAGYISKGLAFPALGLVLILLVWVMPNGAVGFWRSVIRRTSLRNEPSR